MADNNQVNFKDDQVPDASFTPESGSTGGNTTAATGFVGKAKEQVSTLVSDAGEAAKNAAAEGKDKASQALTGLGRAVEEAAQMVEEKIGPQYGQYARRAATGVSGFADTLQNKNVDELIDDTREFVRRSPMVAIGVAAAAGFLLTRLVKLGADGTNYRSTGTRSDRD